MKVAIIGAGLSGLACALELNKHGISPVIFEKRSRVGDVMETPGVTLRIFNTLHQNPLRFFKKEYGLKLSAASNIREINMHSPGKAVTIKGHQGYIFKRGIQEDSLENQLALKANVPIVFDTFVDEKVIHEIKDNFDFTVVASGCTSIPESLGIMSISLHAWSRVAFVDGDFKIDSIEMWINKKYSKNLFCYLVPLSHKEARLVLLVDNISQKELDYYWDEFLKTEELGYKILEIRDCEHRMGTVNPVWHENLYFVGNACGLVDSFLGFGIVNAIESGLIAAHCIVKKLEYTRKIQPIKNNVRIMEEFRKAMNNRENKDFDWLLTFISLPGIKQFIYNNPMFHASSVYPAVKLFNRMRDRE